MPKVRRSKVAKKRSVVAATKVDGGFRITTLKLTPKIRKTLVTGVQFLPSARTAVAP